MGPDWLWVIVFAFGGVSMGMITTFIGLPKGRELFGWLILYVFILLVVFFVDVRWPFWTVVLGSIASGIGVASVQSAFLPKYNKNNPWYESHASKAKAVAALFMFAVFAGAIFGVIVGAVAWGIAAI